MYGMNYSGKLFVDEHTNWLIDEGGFNQPKCQMSVCYKYAPYDSKLFVLYYIDDCVYWYISEELGKWFVDIIVKIFHVNLLGYTHWFMSISISQLKEYYISVCQARYDTYVVAKYIYTTIIKENSKFHKTSLTHDMIFTKEDYSTSDEQVEVFSRESNINYLSCVLSLICILYTRVDLCFVVHNLENSLSNPGKVHFEGLVHLLKYIRDKTTCD